MSCKWEQVIRQHSVNSQTRVPEVAALRVVHVTDEGRRAIGQGGVNAEVEVVIVEEARRVEE